MENQDNPRRAGGLKIRRYPGQKVVINGELTITVTKWEHGQVQLAFEGPKEKYIISRPDRPDPKV